MLASVNGYEGQVGARLLDFFSSKSLWNRSLWTVGIVLVLDEILEASVAQRDGHLGPQTIQELMETAARLVTDDPGVGDDSFRRDLRGVLFPGGSARKDLRYRGLDYHTISQKRDAIRTGYLERWATALTTANPPRPERVARAIASNLLDSGFYADFLHRWWTGKTRHEAGVKPLAQIIREAAALAAIAPRTYKVLVAFPSALQSSPAMKPPANWLNGTEVSKWLGQHKLDAAGITQQGGLLLEVVAREPEGAVQAALEKIEVFAARILVTLRKQVAPLEYAWIEGVGRFPLRRRIRGLKIGAMERENRVWLESDPDGVIDPALELLGPVQLGSSSAAIAGGWAALESMLSEPGNRGEVADRLSMIIACSFPRAELTQLSYIADRENQDIAKALAGVTVNRERCAILAEIILAGKGPSLADPADNAALERMRTLLNDPHKKLSDIRLHVKDALARLYRQRNLILHAGMTGAVAVTATLRTVTPLIGAGMDRIAHFRYIGDIHPIELAARARLALAGVSQRNPMKCIDLLGA